MDSYPTITDSRDMALTHKDFFRILPRAMGDHSHTTDSNGVTAKVHGGEVRIDIGPQQLRKIALMEVPWCKVDFTATGLTEAQFEAFSTHFHRRYQRGGG